MVIEITEGGFGATTTNVGATAAARHTSCCRVSRQSITLALLTDVALPRLAAFHLRPDSAWSFLSLRLITGAENYLDFIDVNTEVVIYDADDGQYLKSRILSLA